MKNWKDIRKDLAAEDPGFEEAVAAHRNLLGFQAALTELREGRGVSQQQLAKELEVSQPNVSRIEHEEDIRLSTLTKYVGALGGTVEIDAVFDGKRVTLIES